MALSSRAGYDGPTTGNERSSQSRLEFGILPMPWIIFSFCVYWLILFVTSYIVVEYSQNYLYDETTPSVGWKLAGGTLLLAILMTVLRNHTSFDTMFTSDIGWTLLQALAWFGVFTLIYRFQPLHGGVLGVCTFLLIGGLASMAVDSLTGEVPAAARVQINQTPKPIRRPAMTKGLPSTGEIKAPDSEVPKEAVKKP